MIETRAMTQAELVEVWASHAELAEAWAHHAYLRSARTCGDLVCSQYTVEGALLMCMFYLWAEDYGPGWARAIEEEDPVLDELVASAGGAA